MRSLAKVLTAAIATIATLGLTAIAQAQPTTSHTRAATTVTAPEGVVTGVSLPCPGHGAPTSITSAPAQPASVNTIKEATGYQLAGVWGSSGNPPPTPPGPFAITVTCSTGTASFKLTIEIAPMPADIAGVGSDTIQNLMDQFGADHNGTVAATAPHLYSWDAANPETGALNDPILVKGIPANVTTCEQPRPDGSSAGITALEVTNGMYQGHPCIDFAGSSRARTGTDPNTISFVNLAGDAVTYATEPGKTGKSNVPPNLTTAQLNAVYECKVTNWNQLPGGGNGTPEIFILHVNSGTREFFLSAIGVASPGPCANDLPTTADPEGTLLENDGVNPAFATNPQNVIVPYSVGAYLAQAFRSATCLNKTCTARSGVACKPAKGQLRFGCNAHGTMRLNEINSTQPTAPYPPTAKSVINIGFSPTFQRLLYEVVANPTSGGFGIPAYLQPLFGPTGFTCKNKAAQTDLKNYGFRVLPQGIAPGDCGFAQ